jgi:Flp pilus assembly pilin Flp
MQTIDFPWNESWRWDEVAGIMKTMRRRLWDDDNGLETLEWLAIAVLILIVAFAVYPGTLQQGLQDVATTIAAKLSEMAAGIGGS